LKSRISSNVDCLMEIFSS